MKIQLGDVVMLSSTKHVDADGRWQCQMCERWWAVPALVVWTSPLDDGWFTIEDGQRRQSFSVWSQALEFVILDTTGVDDD